MFGLYNIRKAIMDKKCFECGKPATEDHHVIPQSLGGTQTVPLCGCCHDRVHEGGWKRRDNHAELTKEGLRRAKERGVVLGNQTNLAEAAKKGGESMVKAANEFALKIYKIIKPLRDQGMTLYQLAEHLNNNDVKTYRDAKWYTSSVQNVWARAEGLLKTHGESLLT